VVLVTAEQDSSHGPPPGAIVRPRQQVEAVRRDAVAAAERRAARSGAAPSHFIAGAISWALGDQEIAPFTCTRTVSGAVDADIYTELGSCRSYLQATPWSEEADAAIGRAQHVLKLLEWLTGADDIPPTYRRETEPGDLVGGRGRIIRSAAEIRRMLQLARANLAAGPASLELGADWLQGVIAALRWVLGDLAESPVLGQVISGLPDGAHVTIEQDEAAERITPPLRPASMPARYCDAVASTCRWLLGGTTRPPVSED
jgi:hypothetical protein